MRAKTGHFGWHDMNTVDLPKSELFYGSLFGWKLDDEPRPNGYRMLSDGRVSFGGMFPWPAEGPEKSHWTGYVLVEDVVGTANAAKSLGGFVPFDSMPLPGTGTLGVVVDPTGAPLTTFRPEYWTDTWDLGPGGSGQAVLWNELITTNLTDSVAFHQALFGWEVDQAVVDAGGYVIARTHGRPVAGIFQPPAPLASSDWITYFDVQNLDEAVKQAGVLGATVAHPATDVSGIGRTAWLVDTNGAIFGLMQPEDGWFERL